MHIFKRAKVSDVAGFEILEIIDDEYMPSFPISEDIMEGKFAASFRFLAEVPVYPTVQTLVFKWQGMFEIVRNVDNTLEAIIDVIGDKETRLLDMPPWKPEGGMEMEKPEVTNTPSWVEMNHMKIAIDFLKKPQEQTHPVTQAPFDPMQKDFLNFGVRYKVDNYYTTIRPTTEFTFYVNGVPTVLNVDTAIKIPYGDQIVSFGKGTYSCTEYKPSYEDQMFFETTDYEECSKYRFVFM